MKFSKILATIAFTAFAVSAKADLISISGGADFAAPGNNDFIAGEMYNIGGNLMADADVTLTFTFLGREASFSNDFFALGDSILLNNQSSAVDDSASGAANAGLIDFRFFTNDITAGVVNGANQPFGSAQSFASILDFDFGGTVYDAVLFYDDSGANLDDNHDDHIIGITATRNVVEASAPGALAFLGLGFLGMGIAKRRKA